MTRSNTQTASRESPALKQLAGIACLWVLFAAFATLMAQVLG